MIYALVLRLAVIVLVGVFFDDDVAGMSLGDARRVPVAVGFERVEDFLTVWKHQLGPRLPQRVHHVVYETHLPVHVTAKTERVLQNSEHWRGVHGGRGIFILFLNCTDQCDSASSLFVWTHSLVGRRS